MTARRFSTVTSREAVASRFHRPKGLSRNFRNETVSRADWMLSITYVGATRSRVTSSCVTTRLRSKIKAIVLSQTPAAIERRRDRKREFFLNGMRCLLCDRRTEASSSRTVWGLITGRVLQRRRDYADDCWRAHASGQEIRSSRRNADCCAVAATAPSFASLSKRFGRIFLLELKATEELRPAVLDGHNFTGLVDCCCDAVDRSGDEDFLPARRN